MEIDDFKNLSNNNQEYLVKISNYESGKAANFMSFTSDVVSNENQCKNDELAGVVIEKPMKQTIPYTQDDLAIKLNSHLYFNTCRPINDDVLVEYKVDNDGIIDGDILLVSKPGTYTIEANATYNNKTVSDRIEVIVELGNEPQINVPELNKRALETLISACETLDLDNYSNINKDNIIKVLDNAKKLLELENLNQDLIDEMVLKLADARDALIKIKFNAEDSEVSKKGNWVILSESILDKGTALKSGVANEEMALEFFGNEITVYGRRAVDVGIIKFIVTKVSDGSELYNGEIDCYSSEKLDQAKLFSWKDDVNDQYRITIINTGKKNSSATNRDTNTIIDYFTVESLTVDMSKLKQLIALIEQENMNEADYTVESWKTFKIALDNAKVLLDNVNATQEEVDLAYNELQIAKDGLVKAIAGLQIVTTDSTVKTLANSGDTIASVKTGDESLAGMFATIALLSAVVYMVLRKKKIIKYNF
ncbi:MAG: FIVAR domain-containing protein [[Clostridium] spiroforme]|uniref:FIVAR domain-containing protein n=2 Tax=Coprobacillaceae TaxID=2810280 RepID=A0A943EH54_9FIRM|nr:FIVAR domain-containing protein [Thomasclavelia spiroformis]